PLTAGSPHPNQHWVPTSPGHQPKCHHINPVNIFASALLFHGDEFDLHINSNAPHKTKQLMHWPGKFPPSQPHGQDNPCHCPRIVLRLSYPTDPSHRISATYHPENYCPDRSARHVAQVLSD